MFFHPRIEQGVQPAGVLLHDGFGAGEAGTGAVRYANTRFLESYPGSESASRGVVGRPVFEVLGVFLGGAVAALTAGRMKLGVLKGPRISSEFRLAFALTGGILMGIAARLARGCTSGQALSGGALLSFGSWVFMFSVFTGGYALARLMKREWL